MKGQVSWFERMAFLAAHPVGGYFWTSSAENPGNKYGGTWEQIKGKFLLAAGDSYAAGSMGGEAEHTLTSNEMPMHSHAIAVEFEPGTVQYGRWQLKLQSGAWSTPDADFIAGSGYTTFTGDNFPHNNMPPYLAAYCWHRTA